MCLEIYETCPKSQRTLPCYLRSMRGVHSATSGSNGQSYWRPGCKWNGFYSNFRQYRDDQSDHEQSPDRLAEFQPRSERDDQIQTAEQHQVLTVNRINDSEPSSIWGTLSANGNIVLLNQNGIIFQQGSIVDAAGLVATASNIDANQFKNGNLQLYSRE